MTLDRLQRVLIIHSSAITNVQNFIVELYGQNVVDETPLDLVRHILLNSDPISGLMCMKKFVGGSLPTELYADSACHHAGLCERKD